MRNILSLIVVVVFFLTPFFLRADSFPKPHAAVNDFANMLDAQTAATLENYLREVHRHSKVAIVVATFESVEGGDIDDFANRLYEAWGIGDKETNEGVLLAISHGDRKARIETGYGVEGFLPDAFVTRLLRERLVPLFREGRYGDGILATTTALTDRIIEAKGLEQLQLGHNYQQFNRYRPQKLGLIGWIVRLLMIGLFIFLFFKNPFAAMILMSGGFGGGRIHGVGGRGGFGGGLSGGGGFGGFGGGLSGGGGGSVSW